jgi:hypothetical protein
MPLHYSLILARLSTAKGTDLPRAELVDDNEFASRLNVRTIM